MSIEVSMDNKDIEGQIPERQATCQDQISWREIPNSLWTLRNFIEPAHNLLILMRLDPVLGRLYLKSKDFIQLLNSIPDTLLGSTVIHGVGTRFRWFLNPVPTTLATEPQPKDLIY